MRVGAYAAYINPVLCCCVSLASVRTSHVRLTSQRASLSCHVLKAEGPGRSGCVGAMRSAVSGADRSSSLSLSGHKAPPEVPAIINWTEIYTSYFANLFWFPAKICFTGEIICEITDQF